jgi:uncharacterized integral membrane protein
MRGFYAVLLLIFLAAIGLFAFQNQENVTLRYLDRSIVMPITLLIAAGYVLGMLSGWTVVGLITRSWRRVTERHYQR